ncbi:TPA: IS110 family transposase [Salmonella enterica]|nr:IS110 family transposase [Salmonella enterica subsp. enterica serovar Abony]EEF3597377.1 IS110 family transposase [Salmonella enterica subsp. enterica serovar Abony]HCL5221500.1 IS110 family transposase [Salmonella enterica]
MTAFVGIDIASQKFDVAVLYGKNSYKCSSFPNSTQGFIAFTNWLQVYGEVHICMEATGAYSTPLATFLDEISVPVSVENPARIHAFAQSELTRNKTDKSDAKMIARYCRLYHPPLWKPAPLYIRQLLSLMSRLDNLKEMLRMEQNRLLTADVIITVSLQENINSLSRQIVVIQQAVKEHINANKELKKNKALLTSIPGVGDILSCMFLAYVGDISKFSNNKKLVAWVGLNPMQQESGLWKGRSKISKKGNVELRKALYMPAVAALTHNPILIDLKNRLKVKNKSGKSIVCAGMKKLLQLMYGVLKSGVPFDAKKSFAN